MKKFLESALNNKAYITNHSSVLSSWINFTDYKIDTIIHIDKHSDFLPFRERIHCGNYLTYYFDNNPEIKQVYWIYPDYFLTLDSYSTMLKEQIDSIQCVLSEKYNYTYEVVNEIHIFTIKSSQQVRSFYICSRLPSEALRKNYVLDIDLDYLYCVRNNKIELDQVSLKYLVSIINQRSSEKFISICSSFDGGYVPSSGHYLLKILKSEIEKSYKQIFDINNNYYYKNFEYFEKFQCLVDRGSKKKLTNMYKKILINEEPLVFSYLGGAQFYYNDGYYELASRNSLRMLEIDGTNPFFLARAILCLNSKDTRISYLLDRLSKQFKIDKVNSYEEFVSHAQKISIASLEFSIQQKFINQLVKESKKFSFIRN